VRDIISLDALTPGTKMQLYIKKVLSNGLRVTFGKENIGYINQIYLENPLYTYTEGMKITGRLLYILPIVKYAYFTLLTEISEKEKLNVGDIEMAKVLYRESNGIIFKLSKTEIRGFVSLRRTNVPPAKISAEFKQNSQHKCRILSYNWMECLYVCTMEHESLKQRYFSTSDFNFGDTLNVTITNIDTHSGYLKVQAGKILGFVPPEHISDIGSSALNKLQIGYSLKARVLNNDGHKIKFTLKESLIKSELPVLHDIHEAQCGSKYHGTVTKIEKTGMLVRFYGNVKGWLPYTKSYDMTRNYSLGQTVTVSIESIEEDKGKMMLKIASDKQEEQSVDFSIGEMVEGIIVDSSVNGVQLQISKHDKSVIGFLPAGHMAPCIEIGNLLSAQCVPGDKMSAFVFFKEPGLTLSRTFVTQEEYRNFDLLKINDCIPCTIREISDDGIIVILPIENYSKFGFVSYKNISNFEMLQVNQILFVKITTINKHTKHLTLSMSLKDIWDNLSDYQIKMMTGVDILSLYLSKLSELSKSSFYQSKPISLAVLGQKVNGIVDKITEHGLVLRLDNNLTGTVRKDHYSSELKVGDKVYGTILWKNYVHELVDVSILPRIVNGINSRQKKLPELPVGFLLRAEILMITKWFILILIKRNGAGYLAVLPVRRHINDISPDLKPYKIRTKIRVYVVVKASETDSVPICMLKSSFEIPKNAIEIKSISSSKKLKRKTKLKHQDISTNPLVKKRKKIGD